VQQQYDLSRETALKTSAVKNYMRNLLLKSNFDTNAFQDSKVFD